MDPTPPCPDPSYLRLYAEGVLTGDARDDLARHVADCPACEKFVGGLTTGPPDSATERWVASREATAPGGPGSSAVAEALPLGAPASGATENFLAETRPDHPTDDLKFLKPPARPGYVGRIGHYDVLGRVGRGGMGLVLRAYDTALDRVVAVKVIAPALAGVEESRARFAREARAAAALNHENVVTIHAVEQDDGVPYLVMECVNGESLHERITRQGALGLDDTLRIGMQIALGLAAAHDRGLVHRDVKPANILLQTSDGRVKITDFGLARAADDVGVTLVGVAAGTPQFMSPEQARGEAVDHRADLFSLGSVLYTACCGRPPFASGPAVVVLRRVSDEAPRPIREINPAVPPWLCDLIGKLHEKDPARRYQTAAEVAALLRQHYERARAGLPEPTPPRRPRLPAALAAAVAALALTAGLATAVAYAPAGVRNRIAWAVPPSLHWATGTPTLRRTATLEGHGDRVKALAFLPDRATLVSGSSDRTVRFWDLATGETHRTVERHDDGVSCLAVSPDGALLASGGWDGAVVLWDVKAGAARATLRDHDEWVTALAFSPDGTTLASGGDDGRVVLWDVATGKAVRALGPEARVRSLAYAPDGATLAVAVAGGEHDHDLQLWDPAAGTLRARLPCHAPLDAVAYTPDGSRLATGGQDRTARVWDPARLRERLRLVGHDYWVTCLAFSPDGARVATGAGDFRREVDTPGQVRVWDAATGRLLAVAVGHLGPVYALAFSPDGRTLATGGADHAVNLWDVSPLAPRRGGLSRAGSGR